MAAVRTVVLSAKKETISLALASGGGRGHGSDGDVDGTNDQREGEAGEPGDPFD